MRLLYELGLGRDVQNTVAVPMVTTAGDQILRMQIRRVAGRCVVGVVADIEPYVNILKTDLSIKLEQGRRKRKSSLPSIKARRSARKLKPP